MLKLSCEKAVLFIKPNILRLRALKLDSKKISLRDHLIPKGLELIPSPLKFGFDFALNLLLRAALKFGFFVIAH